MCHLELHRTLRAGESSMTPRDHPHLYRPSMPLTQRVTVSWSPFHISALRKLPSAGALMEPRVPTPVPRWSKHTPSQKGLSTGGSSVSRILAYPWPILTSFVSQSKLIGHKARENWPKPPTNSGPAAQIFSVAPWAWLEVLSGPSPSCTRKRSQSQAHGGPNPPSSQPSDVRFSMQADQAC